MPKRKPKYVPTVDALGNYTIDAFFDELLPERVPKGPQKPGAAYLSPPEPPPEEARPIRRYTPPAE